jgi:glucokinase
MILAGDIGGTKTVLGLFDTAHGVGQPLRQGTFPSQEYDALETIVASFLAQGAETPVVASFAVAGPVRRGRAKITNLPWVIEAEAISRQAGIPQVHLMNDLQSMAAAVPFLEAEDKVTLRAGIPDPTGAIAVIAPGTGLGEAYLVWDGQRYQAHPSEGGHASFAPCTQDEIDLLAYLIPRFGHLSFERVCSGSGIPNLYEYLLQSGRYAEPGWLKAALAQAQDRTPVIVNAALDRQADICAAALDLFVRILGNKAGNLALSVLSTGGIYLGGGIPPRILPRLQEPDFVAAISHKGRLKPVLDKMPVYVILDSEAPLHGAAYNALEAL